jgi:S1-C subfamily serine protease
VTLVDLAIVLIVVLAAVHGVTQGAALQVLSFGGFWIGLLVGAAIAPVLSGWAQDSAFTSAFISLVAFLGLALLGGAGGRYLGTHAWGALRRRKLGTFDASLGAVVAAVAALAAIWLVALLLSAGPTRNVSRAVHRSFIVRTLVGRLPPAPSVFARLQTLIQDTPFPRVFEGLEPIPSGPIKVPGNAVVQGAVTADQRSTVRIRGFGCGGIQTGSGFVVAPDLVITNAHVVAGIRTPLIDDANGVGRRSTPVLFDPQTDVAILRMSGLAGPPLQLLATDAPRGTGGAILGYPGGGGFDAKPAAIQRRFSAIGRDIYGQGLTRREVYQVQAQVRQGNSGGPFARQDGVVLGVVFAASTSASGLGYALTSTEVRPKVEQAKRNGPTSTGACAA